MGQAGDLSNEIKLQEIIDKLEELGKAFSELSGRIEAMQASLDELRRRP